MSKKTFSLISILMFVLALTVGCNNAPETSKPSAASSVPAGAPATPAPTSTPTASSQASASAMKIEVKVDPAQPNPSKPAKFSAQVTDADGKPVAGADVNVSLVMKEMDMGKNEFKLADKGNGEYQGEGKFGMAGDWDVVVTAKQGDKTVKQTVPVKSVMPKP